MKKLILYIDRLVLNGFDRKDRDAVAEGVRSELGALLGNAGAEQLLTRMGGAHRLRVGNVQIGHDASPAKVGQQIVQGIARRGRR